MTLNSIIILLYICLFIGLTQQIYGTNQKHFVDKENTSISDDDIVNANQQFEEKNKEMKKNRKGKAIVEMIMSPKFSKIVGRKEKHIKSKTQEDEQNDQKNRINQNVASSSNSVEKSHKEKNEKKHKETLKKFISQLNIFIRNRTPSDLHEKKKGKNLKKNKAKVPDDCLECPICYEFANNDHLCFCDHLMSEAIFGSSSNNAQKEPHAFCRECLKGYTKAALETKPFARGWLGLKCMAEKCENPIPWQELKSMLPDELEAIETLESHCAELCVSAACLCLERCPKCNCAVEMDGPLPVADIDTNNDSNEMLKFHCPECNYEMCRKCNEKWAEEHNNLTCEQFAKQQRREKNLKDNQLSKNVVNGFTKCPKCKSPVEKIDGCNHMTCTCKFQFWYCCGAKYKSGHAPSCNWIDFGMLYLAQPL